MQGSEQRRAGASGSPPQRPGSRLSGAPDKTVQKGAEEAGGPTFAHPARARLAWTQPEPVGNDGGARAAAHAHEAAGAHALFARRRLGLEEARAHAGLGARDRACVQPRAARARERLAQPRTLLITRGAQPGEEREPQRGAGAALAEPAAQSGWRRRRELRALLGRRRRVKLDAHGVASSPWLKRLQLESAGLDGVAATHAREHVSILSVPQVDALRECRHCH